MHKLKPDRKRACSPKSIDRIAMIISENWDEVWETVQQRSQTTKEISRHNFRMKFGILKL